MMRVVLVFAGLLILPPLAGQESSGEREGSVSYITSQNIYVRFSSTENIESGDTLYIRRGQEFIPAMRVSSTSSISVVGTPMQGISMKVGDAVIALFPAGIEPGDVMTEKSAAASNAASAGADSTGSVSPEGKSVKSGSGQSIHGRISLSSYSHLSNALDKPGQRMRYTFSLQANNLGNSGLSAETYLSFAHTNSNWEDIQENLFKGLKIYNLSLKYRFDESMYLLWGRKINPRLSSVGAIDGLQFERKFRSLYLGTFAGSRPDYQDYGFNFHLIQYGAYSGYELKRDRISMDNSIAFVEQMNKSRTDRRFIYFQHSSWMWKKLYFFASGEADLYKMVGGQQENVFNLSNIYISVRYRFIRQMSAALTYSSRKNVIYYESYKDFVERLIDNEARQGWRLRLNSRPFKNLSIGLSGGYRYRREDTRPSRNVYAYGTYAGLPGLNASLTLSATWLESVYLNGNIYSAGLSKDFLKGRASAVIKYRHVDYAYTYEEPGFGQSILEADLYFAIYNKLSFSVYYEGTLESPYEYHRIYLNCTQRF
jgi:hypothetical protein